MEILVVGTEEQAEECRQKFGATHAVNRIPQADTLVPADVVFDFDTPQEPSRLANYSNVDADALFLDTTFVRLGDLVRHGILKTAVFGFCGLHTFVNREVLEVVLKSGDDRATLESTCAKLGTSFEVVVDHAGMVTPRVICMIINEAYRTLEEGIATREDIDLAMKLGTNYPWGPFEWGERIGLKNVVRVLEAAGNETGDSRYEICKMLRRSAH